MSGRRATTRRKILEAAAEIARESGPGNLSLDAVAARAGVSKGGLLYHFPSKTALLKAVVESFVASFEEELARRKATKAGRPDAMLEAYLELFVEDHDCRRPPPSGLLAALSQDPDFLAPVRRHDRALLDRMRQNARDPAMALVVYLAIQGMRATNLLGLDVMSDEEFSEAVGKLKAIVGGA
ncbi:MAG TPA: TetR/AcrR family transcriptional regulator [Aquamicrobium sp.]|jgi:AcrR family transcriptional regulator|nr:TetR/AcrR family transcriptional regulator [Aquamicrobium sp.]